MEIWHGAMENFFFQMEGYVSLLQYLQPRFAFPPIDGSAIAPDLALTLVAQIHERRPSLILELGSGVSTLISGYMVQRNQHGRVVSIEHELRYLKRTESAVRLHGLSDCVELIHAPLAAYDGDHQQLTWYDTSFVDRLGERSVDMLFVDGPPATIGRLARFPALPALRRSLSENAVILVDDAHRPDEREMVQQWLQAFPELEEQWLNTHKGAALLTFRESDNNGSE